MVLDNEQWIKEQEANHMFRHSGQNAEALKLLEKTPTNRDINGSEQGRLLIVLRSVAALGWSHYGVICDEVEKTQMNVDNQARKDYMKTVVEQWQGKNQVSASRNVKALV